VLPPKFAAYETRRYVVLSDASPGWTGTQAQILERTHHQFHRFCNRLGLEPAPLRHKLVAVAFEDRRAYQRFAVERDDVTNPALSGYYAPRFDRVVFYHVESNPSVVEARDQLQRMKGEVRELGRQARTARGSEAEALRQVHARYQHHLHEQERRVQRFSVQTTGATTIHEACHQLMFHTGVQSSSVQYPLWICEGLATTFESDAPEGAFGPDHEYAPRRRAFAALMDVGPLLPLRELVTLCTLPPNDPDRTHIVYSQSYALLSWMSRFRRDELRAYLETMRSQPPGRPSRATHLQIFERCFGDVDALERAWTKHEQTLPANR
jgi:hypothetical protein